jgi:hypothetical protein
VGGRPPELPRFESETRHRDRGELSCRTGTCVAKALDCGAGRRRGVTLRGPPCAPYAT